MVSKPTSRGFGTRSVIASIETQLGGKADFDWRQEGEQTWDITTRLADRRVLKLSKGGSRLEIDGHLMVEEPPAEYEAIYDHFSVLLARRQSDVDVAPLRLVADAFLVGNRMAVEPFL